MLDLHHNPNPQGISSMSRDYGSRQFVTYAKWDMVRGRELWNRGMRAQEIADELGTTEKGVMGAAMRHGWPPRRLRKPLETKRGSGPTPTIRRCSECWAPHNASQPHDCKGRATTPRFESGWAA